MLKVIAPRLSLDECRNEREQAFLECLNRRAEAGCWCADAWVWDDRVVLGVCPYDLDMKRILRSLRVDFDGYRLAFGPDETHQFVGDLDARRPDVTVVTDGNPQELSVVAANWLEREMKRPIIRNQWFRFSFNRITWTLQDTGETLMVSDTGGKVHRPGLAGPTESVKVWPRETPPRRR